LLLLLFLGCACSPLRPQVVLGPVRGVTVWSGTIQVDGDVIIEESAELRIAPGTEIIFLPPTAGRDQLIDHPHFIGSELIVYGRLIAEGTAQQPITFRYLDPTAKAGSWGGINLINAPYVSLRYCRFSQADSAVHSQGSQVEVSCSLFENNLVGIRFNASQIRIEHNLLQHNATAIRFHFGSPIIVGNELRNNHKGFFITSFPEEYTISGNNIVSSRDASVVLGEENPEDVVMPGNYWGTANPALVEAGLVDGRRIDYLGQVRYLPLAELPFADAGLTTCSP
jgi:hypothetical protein